jgi:predicted MPP superfamily phosphohydrolase
MKLASKRLWEVLTGFGLLGGLYIWQIEPRWVEFKQVDMVLKGLPDSLMGKRLVQISDLHVGQQFSPKILLPALKRAQALNPDIVVYTGDFVNDESALQSGQLAQVLAVAPLGKLATLGVLGNHDYGEGWGQAEVAEQVVRVVENAGISILRNEVVHVEGLEIAGIDAILGTNCHPSRALSQLSYNQAAIALLHNPDGADLPIWDNFEGWILSGHTHGGQMKVPFLRPPRLPVKNKNYDAGIFHLHEKRTLYINRALGHSRQIRLNVRPEITVFTLTGKGQSGKQLT